jgi:EPS-associated MarR family transcriptional regulator
MLDDETRYRLLKRLQADPDVSQRALAQELGISLGKLNYCLRAVIAKGWVKAANFRNSRNKKAYAYYLTPQGIEEKARVTGRFLRRKIAEYEAVQREIEELRREVQVAGEGSGANSAAHR